jgi:hypothetical protein
MWQLLRHARPSEGRSASSGQWSAGLQCRQDMDRMGLTKSPRDSDKVLISTASGGAMPLCCAFCLAPPASIVMCGLSAFM